MKYILEGPAEEIFEVRFADLKPALSIPANPGAYILFIFLGQKQNIRAGALGNITFLPGWYAYVGSAMGGLRARVYRHLKRDKKIRWHIDYFLSVGELKEVFVMESARKIECSISRCLAKRLLPAVLHFGTSDCTCKTHLFFASTKVELRKAVEETYQSMFNGKTFYGR
ncbi:MAG: GIY-YIG nuclease family protein [Bacillota bacterium]